MSSYIGGDRANLSNLREALRRELFESLDNCGVGPKALVWDEALLGLFGLVVDTFKILQDHQVDKMFNLKDLVEGRLRDSLRAIKNVVFITRPKLRLVELVEKIVKSEERAAGVDREFHLIYVPRISSLCQKRLEELGVLGSFSVVDEFSMDLVPLDSDVLSMEAASAFKECYLLKDRTVVYRVAKGLMKLQALYGVIPLITEFNGRESLAENVSNILFRMRREMAGMEPQMNPQIDHLVLIDRDVDPITALLTPLTYEGLIDETFGIAHNRVKLPPEKFVKRSDEGVAEMPLEPTTLLLSSAEELFAELRDKNFQAVGPVLSRKAKDLTLDFRDKDNAKSVADLKKLVAKLPHMQAAKKSLANHTSVAELVKEVVDSEEFGQTLATQQTFYCLETDKENSYILDSIARREPLAKILRLVCLQSVCNDGLRKSVYDMYKKDILQVYGFQHLLTLSRLEKCGLFEPSRLSSGKTYQTLSKILKLVDENEEANPQERDINPKDVSFVFSMYAPLSVRLVQNLSKPHWRKHECIRLLPGPVNERSQTPSPKVREPSSESNSSVISATSAMSAISLSSGTTSPNSATSASFNRTSDTSRSSGGDTVGSGGGSSGSGGSNGVYRRKRKVLVFFIGGVTFAEIAALRFLSQQEDAAAEFAVGATKIINADSWMESIVGDVVKENLVGV